MIRVKKKTNLVCLILRLASLFASIAIQTCIDQFQKWNRDTPETSKPTIDHLYQVMAICKEISYKATLNLIEQESHEKNMKYLCIWEELQNKHESKFENFILRNMKYETNEDPTVVKQVFSKYVRANEMEFHVFETPTMELTYEDAIASEDADLICSVKIIINPIGNKGEIVFYNRNGEETKRKNITIKKYGSQTALLV